MFKGNKFLNNFFENNNCSCSTPCDSFFVHLFVSFSNGLFPVFRFLFSKLVFTVVLVVFAVFSLLYFPGLSSASVSLSSTGFSNDYDVDSFFYKDSSRELYYSFLESDFALKSNSHISDVDYSSFASSFSSNLVDGSYLGFVEFYDVMVSRDESEVMCLFVLSISDSTSLTTSSVLNNTGETLVYVYGFSNLQCPASPPAHASFTSVSNEVSLSNFFVFDSLATIS